MTPTAHEETIKFYRLCNMAVHQKRCLSCLQPVEQKNGKGRSRVICNKPECAKEYQRLYYYNVTKIQRHELTESLSPEQREERAFARKLIRISRESAASNSNAEAGAF